MQIRFKPEPGKEDIKFIDKDEDMSCIIFCKGDTWEGKIEQVTSSGYYVVELIRIIDHTLDKK